MILDVTTAWYWEGNVVETIADFLEREGWKIVSMADTHAKAQGVDLCKLGERSLLSSDEELARNH